MTQRSSGPLVKIFSVWDAGILTTRISSNECHIGTYILLVTDCAKNSAIVSYCFFFKPKESNFSLRALNFKLLRNRSSVYKGYSVNLASSLICLHFIYFMVLSATKVGALLLRSFSTYPSLVSKEKPGERSKPRDCRNWQRRWGGWGAVGRPALHPSGPFLLI